MIWAIFEIANSNFLTAGNLTNLALQITGTALISIGVVLVLLLGEIDLSVGAVSGFAAGVTAVLSVNHGWAPVPAIAAGIATGAGIGLLQGLLATRFGIPSFIITLAGLLAWQGALLQVLGSTGTVNLTNPTIVGIANTFYSPAVSWILAGVAIAAYAGTSFVGHLRRRSGGASWRGGGARRDPSRAGRRDRDRRHRGVHLRPRHAAAGRDPRRVRRLLSVPRNDAHASAGTSTPSAAATARSPISARRRGAAASTSHACEWPCSCSPARWPRSAGSSTPRACSR